MNRRAMLKAGSAVLVGGMTVAGEMKTVAANAASSRTTGRWDVFEEVFAGPKDSNPFIEVWLKAAFRKGNREIPVDGFYDGNGAYKVRFMPDELGTWTFETDSNVAALKGKKGAFNCRPPQTGNHGPVSVRDTHHFGYADGTDRKSVV